MRAAAVSPAGAACVGNVITSVVSTCLYYRLLWALQSSPAFGVQLCTFMQAVVCGALLLLARCVGVKRPPAAPKFRAWLELSVWFSLQNTLEIAAVDGLGPANGNLTPVLQQAVIPVTIVLSSVLLRQTFCRLHWMAAGIVIVGIVASYAPLLLTNAESIRPKWGWAVLFLGSRLPQAIGNVRCEAVLLPLASADKAEVAADDGGGSPAVARRRQSVQLLLACGFWTASLGLALNFISSVMLACIRGLGAASVLDDYSSGARCLLNLNATAASTDPCRAAPGATAAFALPGVLFAISEFQVCSFQTPVGSRRKSEWPASNRSLCE